MEKSISNRFYFDYNATSPLAKKVTDFLHSGDFLFGNPASLHQTGKKSRKLINETTDFLYKTFALNPKDHKIIYHSGASEGINSVFKGIAFSKFKEHKKVVFFFSQVDHSCVVELKDYLEALGHKVVFFSVDKNGNFDLDKLIEAITFETSAGQESFVNFTYVNNESGVVWPLAWAREIKDKTSAFIHVDAVQVVGKIPKWNELQGELDSYTFSGHKFGSMKGVGFTFIQKKYSFPSLISGGSQQEGMRAGTENSIGVLSLKLALEEMLLNFNADELLTAKNFIEKGIAQLIGSKGEIVAQSNENRNLNTIFLILYGHKAETLSIKFDLNSIDLSTGSACSSGIIKESRVLMGMGHSHEDSRAALRFSFSPFMKLPEAKEYLEKINFILKGIIS